MKYRAMSFQNMIDRMKHAPMEYHDRHGVFSVVFYGHDLNEHRVSVMRDGKDTASVDLGHLDQRDGVNIFRIEMLLNDTGFVVQRSAWTAQDGLEKLPQTDAGYIYIIQMQDSDLYKIGKTKHYTSRLALLGVLMPKPCDFVGVWKVKSMTAMETILHGDYAVFHSNGEWFEIQSVGKLIDFLNHSGVRVK